MKTRTTVSLAGVAVIVAAVLSGCTPTPAPLHTGSPSPSPSGSTPATGSPSPSAAPVDPNVLFTITARATAPNGAVADLTQIVYRPVPASREATAISQLDSECNGWQANYGASPQFIESTATATDVSPHGTSWTGNPAVVSMNGFPVFTGDFSSFQSPCASVFVAIGTAHGVSPVDSGSPDVGRGWATYYYGFGTTTEDPGATSPGPNDVVIDNCSIAVSATAASSSSIAAHWPTEPQQYPGLGCSYGSPF